MLSQINLQSTNEVLLIYKCVMNHLLHVKIVSVNVNYAADLFGNRMYSDIMWNTAFTIMFKEWNDM
jgi:hypothetical protein